VPAWIGALRSLTYLNVSENLLGELPPEIGGLGSLIELRALDAGLSGLPALDGLVSLRELHLRRNRFVELPESVRALRSLRLLDLRSNRLASLPEWIAELPDLQKLDLRWNEPVLEPPAALLARGCVVLTE
jgi:Leucine-rich repeat (LRR) protein